MNTENIGRSLHDRATRGEHLTDEESRQLEAWYTMQDRTEAKTLDLTASSTSLAALQTQVDSVLGQLSLVSQRIQQIARENDTLRHEISVLRRQLAQKAMLQPA
jgi:peptidoglycan hydrolase CwlO-like protein